MKTADYATDAEVFAVETEERLSRSILWRLQRAFFEQAGVTAWSTRTVPDQVTNHPALAHAYAEVALGFLRDCARSDPGRPVTLVELGAGSGRFAYRFLKAFVDLLRRSPLAGAPFRYVMTDFTVANVEFWRAHAALRPFREQGLLDFAVFDAEADRELRLLEGGTTIGPGGLDGPLIVIANYVFDGISQDAFTCVEGRLHEWRVSITSPDQVVALDDPTLLDRLVVEYDHRPAPADYYGEPELDAVLAGYARHGLAGRTAYFPCAAIRCIDRLAALSGSSLLISADRGQIHEDAIGEPGPPQMATHGSFSLTVDYHAIAEYVRRRGGHVLQTSRRAAHLTIAAFLLGEHASRRAETRLAFEQGVDLGGPDDFFSLRRGLAERDAQLGLEALLALIRLSRWDPQVLRDCLPALRSQLGAASAATKQDLARAVSRAWDNYYPIGEERDPTRDFARLLYDAGDPAAALELYRAAARGRADDAEAQWNVGVCLFALGRLDEAATCFAAAASLDPGFRPAPSDSAL